MLWPAWCSWPLSAFQAQVSTDPSLFLACGGNSNKRPAAAMAMGLAPTPAPQPMVCRALQHPLLRCSAQVRPCWRLSHLYVLHRLLQSCRHPCVMRGQLHREQLPF